MKQKLDWQGLPISQNEKPDDKCLVWEIDPPLHTNSYDVVWIRSYSEMQDYISNNLSMWFDDYTEEQLRDGISLNVKLVETTVDMIPEAE